MPFEIIRHDIVSIKADAIVNTANPEPVIGRGTDTAIHEKAGPKLLEARKEIGRIEPGCSAATPAFGLDAKYVIHTVTSFWVDGKHGETEILRKAYDSALELADSHKCESIAFPLLAAGTYGFPKETAMSVAISAFTDFLLSHDMKILLVVFNSEAYSLAGSLFDDVKSFVDDNYVDEKTVWERRSETSSRRSERPKWDHFTQSSAPQSSRPAGSHVSHGISYAEDHMADETSIKEEREILNATIEISKAKIREILKEQESTFVEFLRDIIREKDIKDSEVYRRAGMSRQLFNKIINNLEYQPTKRTVYQLIIGLQLSMDQAQKLMRKAGFSITRSSKTDLVMEYFIRHGRYNIIEIDIALEDAGLPALTRA